MKGHAVLLNHVTHKWPNIIYYITIQVPNYMPSLAKPMSLVPPPRVEGSQRNSLLCFIFSFVKVEFFAITKAANVCLNVCGGSSSPPMVFFNWPPSFKAICCQNSISLRGFNGSCCRCCCSCCFRRFLDVVLVSISPSSCIDSILLGCRRGCKSQ